MALAVDVIDRRGPRDEICHWLQPKKMFYLPFIASKTKSISFKSGCVVYVENGIMLCQKRPRKGYISHLYSSKRCFICTITNKTKRFSFKSRCVVRVAKHLKGDWFIVRMGKY